MHVLSEGASRSGSRNVVFESVLNFRRWTRSPPPQKKEIVAVSYTPSSEVCTVEDGPCITMAQVTQLWQCSNS